MILKVVAKGRHPRSTADDFCSNHSVVQSTLGTLHPIPSIQVLPPVFAFLQVLLCWLQLRAFGVWQLKTTKNHCKFKLSPLSDGPSGPKKSPSCTTSSVSQSCPIKICTLHDELIGATTLQSIMNTKLSKQRFWHCCEKRLIKAIQTIPHNLYVNVKLTFLLWIKAYPGLS